MTTLLDEAIERVRALHLEDQERIAELMLAEAEEDAFDRAIAKDADILIAWADEQIAAGLVDDREPDAE